VPPSDNLIDSATRILTNDVDAPQQRGVSQQEETILPVKAGASDNPSSPPTLIAKPLAELTFPLPVLIYTLWPVDNRASILY
jgi:hypothetical protein